jgi:uncharacterized protein (TIGR03086 family)
VESITPAALSNPTPCAGWDLRELLLHLNDSLRALQEGADVGCLDLVPGPPSAPRAADDLVADFRAGAAGLLTSWPSTMLPDADIRIEGHLISVNTVEIVGAIEIAVHGWDIFESCGRHRPIPVNLALDMLRVLPMVVDNLVRPALFAAPVEVSRLGSPSDRLVAFLGRRPRRGADLFRDDFSGPPGS